MFVSLLGLPGVGKTTLGRALAELLGARFFPEPEEDDWPAFVRRPHENGAFTALSWFRGQRVPYYYEAERLRRAGRSAVLDSYYDKWCVAWLGRPGLEWLIQPDDPYLPTALAMAETDAQILPRADLVVMLEIDEELWRAQLVKRGRRIDTRADFQRSHHSQDLFHAAAMRSAARDGTRLVFHQRQDIPPELEANQLLEQLEALGLSELSTSPGAERRR